MIGWVSFLEIVLRLHVKLMAPTITFQTTTELRSVRL